MKKENIAVLILSALILATVFSINSTARDCKTYEDVTLSDWGSGNFDENWDLTRCDLTLSYKIDMSNIENPGWVLTEVGLREVGAGNIDPNLKGGWMQSKYHSDSSNDESRDNNDLHILMKHGWEYDEYNATDPETLVSPYWNNINHGFWFDRDGVDSTQKTFWGYIDGATYNTSGVYNVVINYHAIGDSQATMFATVNGEQQGFYTSGWKDAPPEKYPMGRSFTGDMTHMQVFYGRNTGGGTVELSEIQVCGCQYREPVPVMSPIGLIALTCSIGFIAALFIRRR